jgi:hypothetical protein
MHVAKRSQTTGAPAAPHAAAARSSAPPPAWWEPSRLMTLQPAARCPPWSVAASPRPAMEQLCGWPTSGVHAIGRLLHATSPVCPHPASAYQTVPARSPSPPANSCARPRRRQLPRHLAHWVCMMHLAPAVTAASWPPMAPAALARWTVRVPAVPRPTSTPAVGQAPSGVCWCFLSFLFPSSFSVLRSLCLQSPAYIIQPCQSR